ncbi:uncharacterized protein LOC128893817 [Hylaeus anthracinus]|uniref:uncharacterized protein LOC128893817 n=1 Tax=Hylaeus anthracinus TaxID=313031 RepID=UPI0023B94CB3|nr:uncharacterized protein LOC128893817 [Hylaeus anthracinus]
MGLVNAVYNWGTVKALYFAVFSMNLAGVVAVATTIVWAARFQRGFGDYLNLVSSGDGHVWTTVIISSAVLCSPAYVLGAKSWLYLKFESSRNELEDQQEVEAGADPRDSNRLLFFHVIACLVSGFLVALLNATYLALLSGFQQKSREGMIEAMERYSSDVTAKARVDAVQTEFECCGDNSYEDWFHVPWLKPSMEESEFKNKGPRLEGQPVQEDGEEESSTPIDVPFSCCANDIPKPCVHYDILNRNAAYDYNPKHLTISTRGCRSGIVSRGRTVRIFLAGYLALLSVYQVILSLLARLLQTAHANELFISPRKTRYHVWIFYKPEEIFNVSLTQPKASKQSRRRKRRSTRKSRPPSSSSTLETFHEKRETISSKRHKMIKSTSAKVLNKIRSKIHSAKSKSYPLVRSSLWTTKRSTKRRAYQSEDEDEKDEEDEESEQTATKRLLSSQWMRSAIVLKPDGESNPFLQDNTLIIDLPPPPPLPPFVANLEVEDEKNRPPRDVSPRRSRAKINADTNSKQKTIHNQNSGRRIKVLEKFDKIWESHDRATQHRESGGADDSSSEHSSNRSRRLLSTTDVYDRFRGTLQHTLARRETVQARRASKRIHSPRVWPNLDTRRNNLLARLGSKNVPPSYRLLANVEDQRRSVLQTQPIPLPPPLPPPSTRNTLAFPHRDRQCSICHRPVQQSLSLSRCEDTRAFSTPCPRRMPLNVFTEGRKGSAEDYEAWNRSTFAFESVQRR